MDLRNERILVTGGSGFLGHHVLAELSSLGCQNVHAPTHGDFDLTLERDVQRLYAATKPSVLIHLAGEVGGIGANQANPGRFFYANMAMGLHLIEHARRAGVRKFVQVGTVCAYPKFATVPFREDELWAGFPEETNAPYGIAKRSLLVMLQSYRRQYGLNGIFLVPANLYGPGDNFDVERGHVIPSIIRKCMAARRRGDARVQLWGTGVATREFLFVRDCAVGIVLAAAHYDDAEPVNLGTGIETSISELAERIRQLVGFTGTIEWDRTHPDGQPRRCLATSRARAFGFVARTSLLAGLSETVRWWQGQMAGG